MSLFSDANCTLPKLLDANSTSFDCVLLTDPTFVTTAKGLGMIAASCSGTGEPKIVGCTNVTGLWLNRRMMPTSGAGVKKQGWAVVVGVVVVMAMVNA
ncbi:hypothetical protein HDU96_004147 [Phlyctochytrium bullatum]|nr:hypothetical protein HDU96_004147 [Phlyctochytrium bullatum]